MKFLANLRQKRAAAAAQRAAAQAAARYGEWDERRVALEGMLAAARSFEGFTSGPDVRLPLKKGETVVGTVTDAGLVEPRRAPGHYVGGYHGVSFHIAKGVRYNVGGSRGSYVPGEEKPTSVDTGTVSITNQRVVFTGQKESREWLYTKLLGMTHEADDWTALPVSNRQKVSGIAYGAAIADWVRFRLALGWAISTGDRASLISEVQQEIAQHAATRPAQPAIAPPIAPPAAGE